MFVFLGILLSGILVASSATPAPAEAEIRGFIDSPHSAQMSDAKINQLLGAPVTMMGRTNIITIQEFLATRVQSQMIITGDRMTVKEGRMAVVIRISSAGGFISEELLTVLKLLDYAASFGVDVTCVGSGEVGSAALILFSHCPTRVVEPGTLITWHRVFEPGKQGIPNAELDEASDQLWARLRSAVEVNYFNLSYEIPAGVSFPIEEVMQHTTPGFFRVGYLETHK